MALQSVEMHILARYVILVGGIGIPSDGISEGDDTTPEVGKEHMNSTALGFCSQSILASKHYP